MDRDLRLLERQALSGDDDALFWWRHRLAGIGQHFAADQPELLDRCLRGTVRGYNLSWDNVASILGFIYRHAPSIQPLTPLWNRAVSRQHGQDIPFIAMVVISETPEMQAIKAGENARSRSMEMRELIEDAPMMISFAPINHQHVTSHGGLYRKAAHTSKEMRAAPCCAWSEITSWDGEGAIRKEAQKFLEAPAVNKVVATMKTYRQWWRMI